MKVMPILGVRPQIIKSAPILRLLKEDHEITLLVVHSGQHHDFEMSNIFFNELELPTPLHNLGVGGGSHATQTARIMVRTEKVINDLKPDVVMVFGDANTALAGALAAIKMRIPVCHVEAGLRSYDMSMPEEVNRVLVDHCSQVLYAPTQTAVKNLTQEGVDKENIVLSGDTMYDSLLKHKDDIERSSIIERLDLTGVTYLVLTIHRPRNVDDPERLRKIVASITKLKEATIIFPVHPKTEKGLEKTNLDETLKKVPNVILTKPLGYFDMIKLMKHSQAVLTDSGGMQKESFLLHIPCVTLRHNTEWLETVKMKANVLVGGETERMVAETRRILKDRGLKKKLKSLPNPYGDGKASHRIVEDLKDRFHSGELTIGSQKQIS